MYILYYAQNGRGMKRFCNVSRHKGLSVVSSKKINNFVLIKQYIVTLLIAKKIDQWMSVHDVVCRPSLAVLCSMLKCLTCAQ